MGVKDIERGQGIGEGWSGAWWQRDGVTCSQLGEVAQVFERTIPSGHHWVPRPVSQPSSLSVASITSIMQTDVVSSLYGENQKNVLGVAQFFLFF